MATVDVLNWEKKKVGQIDLPKEVFEAEVKPSLLHEVVRWQLACRRRGTHMAKTKGEVQGSGKKPFKQKGTGNARQGDKRSPLFPKGGITFGPRPRDYSYNLPKKVRQLGLSSALSQLFKDGKVFVVEDMKADGKTKEIAKRMKTFGLNKAVLVSGSGDEMFSRAARNLQGVRYYSVDGLNVYDLLRYGSLIFSKDSLAAISRRCGVGGDL